MQFVGSNVRKIEAERSDKLEPRLRIKTNVGLDNVEKKELLSAGDKKDGAVIDYNFVVNYGESSGKIVINGSLFVIGDKKELTAIVKEWTKNKNFKAEFSVPIMNKIMELALLAAIPVAKELSLPVPVQFPRFVAEEKGKASKQDYVG